MITLTKNADSIRINVYDIPNNATFYMECDGYIFPAIKKVLRDCHAVIALTQESFYVDMGTINIVRYCDFILKEKHDA